MKYGTPNRGKQTTIQRQGIGFDIGHVVGQVGSFGQGDVGVGGDFDKTAPVTFDNGAVYDNFGVHRELFAKGHRCVTHYSLFIGVNVGAGGVFEQGSLGSAQSLGSMDHHRYRPSAAGRGFTDMAAGFGVVSQSSGVHVEHKPDRVLVKVAGRVIVKKVTQVAAGDE